MASALAQPLSPQLQAVADMYDVARYDFRAFASILTGWKIPPHQRTICEYLQRVESTPDSRLIITMPPRHGKSETGSIAFPTWCLGRGYTGLGSIRRVAIAGYGKDLAVKFSAAVRDHFADPHDPTNDVFPGLRLTKKSDSEWRLWPAAANRPSCFGIGVGGAFTGKGADLVIIDDPIKRPEDVQSQRQRDKVWDWWEKVASTRFQKGARCVVIMTRWHEDDLVGRLLAQGGWELLHLKAISDDGEALWPAAYPIDVLRRKRLEMGSQAFDALYQGEPTPAEGNVWKRTWFDDSGYVGADAVPELIWTATAWDTAYKTGEQNDYTAWCTIGADAKGDLWVLDIGHERLEFPDLAAAINHCHGRTATEPALIEDNASGPSAIQTLRRESRRPVIAVKADRDKTTRAQAVTPFVEAGKVHLPKQHAFYEPLVDECTSFPNGLHDDMMDAFVHAVRYGMDKLDKRIDEVFWL